MSIQVGTRVRLLFEVSTRGGITYPAGSTGVVFSVGNLCGVDMDTGAQLYVMERKLEEYTPVFASHYQAQPSQYDDGSTDDAPNHTSVQKEEESTSLTGDELMDITRSFCR